MGSTGKRRFGRLIAGMAVTVICILASARPCSGYSVILHEALVDAAWDRQLRPFLLARFPHATPQELHTARLYAYGGAIIQDVGYYPFGDHLFSYLTHYVRSGDFVANLFAESKDLNDYAFALGALSHYCADVQGHYFGINRAVPLLYPRLGRKFGSFITWEENRYAHLFTEFGFDTLQVAAGHVTVEQYHDWADFRVPDPLLQRAYQRTYGLELSPKISSFRVTLWQKVARELIPGMTQVAWALRRDSPVERTAAHQPSPLGPRRRGARRSAGTPVKPGLGAKFVAWFIRAMPGVGPLYGFKFHTPTPQTEQLFDASAKAALTDYDLRIQIASSAPPNVDLDTGGLTRPGEYRYCDSSYADLLHELAKSRFAAVTPELRNNILTFYQDSANDTIRKKHRKWRRVQRELQKLESSAPVPTPSP